MQNPKMLGNTWKKGFVQNRDEYQTWRWYSVHAWGSLRAWKELRISLLQGRELQGQTKGKSSTQRFWPMEGRELIEQVQKLVSLLEW